ncbi:glycoprotein-N-acetylgalactosamine 3-beta-galactosyltransferase 1-like [Anastrepha ludens]|uniref:glycoprotein-N-acetylgalactosamine 3-beta-galactosyltransferase 1-like n=1 Tax=Anastrepha ludens TaxID=28586 RepID=UPI0023B0CBA6|nr:glycoprotein-N-acetylgalactosamine 3-beta-galactosyltransferase 1-like [Anastrepha ludens]
MSQHRRITFVAIEIALIAVFLSYRHGFVDLQKLTRLRSANSQPNVPLQNSTNSTNLADQLADEVRILCWVMTTPANHKTKAIHVRRTWGRRCNRLLFVTSQADEDLGETLVITAVEDTYEKIWAKTRLAFEQIYHKYGDDMDWFYKADDDTFAFIENMRYMLYPYSPDIPIYFGHNFKLQRNIEQVYMSGGSGYVLSRESLRRFVESAIVNNTNCDAINDHQPEDVAMGQCLRAVNVTAGDSRDTHGEWRFFPFTPFDALTETQPSDDYWFLFYSFYTPRACRDCLSKYAVAFHYIPPEAMYFYEFFAYEFRAYGLPDEPEYVLPKKLAIDEVVIPKPDNIWDIVSP